MTPPDVPAFLDVFYIEDDGTVVNLAPRNGAIRKQTTPKSEALVFGDGRDGRQTFRVTSLKSTDARGGDAYNTHLSPRRANAVRSRLIQFHNIDGGRLTAEGRGRRELKDPARPEDGVNRRVQIKTITDKTS